MNMNDAEKIAQHWMDSCCQTIKDYDHGAHMNLISKDVQVFGVPGYDVISYADWYSQCEYEFSEKLIDQTSYQGLKIRHSDDHQVKFLTNETVHTTDGTVDSHPIEVLLAKEDDDQWRVIEERLLSRQEAKELELS